GHVHAAICCIVLKAQAQPRQTVFPEGDHPKLLRAAQIVVDEGIARPILLGWRNEIALRARELDLEDLIERVEIINPREFPKYEEYAQLYFERRQRKGSTIDHARPMTGRRNPFGMMMVQKGDADGVVAGITSAYPETIRPALEIIGIRAGVKKAAGMYMMVFKNDVKFFADATVNIDPDAETLAET